MSKKSLKEALNYSIWLSLLTNFQITWPILIQLVAMKLTILVLVTASKEKINCKNKIP